MSGALGRMGKRQVRRRHSGYEGALGLDGLVAGIKGELY